MHLFNACGQFESMAASVPETSPTGTPPRRRWHLHRIVIVSGLIVLVVGIVIVYFTDYQKALRAIHQAGGTTDADLMDEGPSVVRRVMLAGPTITDAEIERVAPHLPHLPELFTLDLSMSRVTDRGLGLLRGLAH